MKTLWTCFVVLLSLFVTGNPFFGQGTLEEKLAAIKKDDWRAAESLGSELARLPGHQGFEWLKKNWGKAEFVSTRQQILKAFAFSGNADTLKVLDLGMKDASPEVQHWSMIYLKNIAFIDFSLDFSKYPAWSKKYLDKPLEEVREECASTFVQSLISSTDKEWDDLLKLCMTEEILKLKPQPRALSVAIKILKLPGASQEAQMALRYMLIWGNPDEAYVQKYLLPELKAGESRFRIKAAAIEALGRIQKPWALDELCAELKSVTSKAGEILGVMELGEAIASYKDYSKIPFLIGIIDSHNGYETVYELGAFGLAKLTDVRYDDSHDGEWWKSWWEKNKARYPENVRSLNIPNLPKSAGYKPTDTPAKAIADLESAIQKGEVERLNTILYGLQTMRVVKVVPYLIAVMIADNSQDTLFPIGQALEQLAGVQYEKNHDAAWWKNWWDTNKSRFAEAAPDGTLPKVKLGAKKPGDERIPGAADVDDIPTTNNFAGGDRNKRYLLSGPLPGSKSPANGYKLFVILPGGDGSADFHPFLKRVYRNSFGEEYLIVQLVARRWQTDTENWIVWPTSQLRVPGMQFTTEDFIEDVIGEVKKKQKIDAKSVYVCGWSSSGPGLYPYLLGKKRSATGAFIAMSIFNDGLVPSEQGDVSNFPIFILHSPQDFIPIVQAEKARDFFKRQGANVLYNTYEGGHGWHGDIFGYFAKAKDFLEGKKE